MKIDKHNSFFHMILCPLAHFMTSYQALARGQQEGLNIFEPQKRGIMNFRKMSARGD